MQKFELAEFTIFGILFHIYPSFRETGEQKGSETVESQKRKKYLSNLKPEIVASTPDT